MDYVAAEGSLDQDEALGGRRGSIESTVSERDFRNRFTYITHRMVHRKVAGEMFRRRLASEPIECDKTVNVRRGSGEFGLRVHGARPVVVASVEPESPALSSGLEVGDILISVNGVNVLESPHSEVIRIAHAGEGRHAATPPRPVAMHALLHARWPGCLPGSWQADCALLMRRDGAAAAGGGPHLPRAHAHGPGAGRALAALLRLPLAPGLGADALAAAVGLPPEGQLALLLQD